MKEKWATLANDSNSPFIRNYIWTEAYKLWPSIGLPQVMLGILSQQNDIDYLAIKSTWKHASELFFSKVKHNPIMLDKAIDETMAFGVKMNAFTEKIFMRDLTRCSAKDLIAMYHEFAVMQSREYALGVKIPLVDFGGSPFVETHLIEFLKKNVPKGNFQEYFDAFTFPSHSSFAEEQELALLKIYEELQKDRPILSSLTVEDIQKKHPKLYPWLASHAEKYAWVYYVYQGPAFSVENFVEFLRDYRQKNIDPAAEIKKKMDARKAMEGKREKLLASLKPDKGTEQLLLLAGKIVWAKPRRKDLQSKSYYHIERLQQEIATRLNLTLQQVRATSLDDLDSYLSGKKPIDEAKIREIERIHVCIPDENGDTKILYGHDAEQFMKTEFVPLHQTVEQASELKGACACPGSLVKGIARIINKPEDMAKMNYGDILVSVATTPAIVPAMKKAAAIVTDEGGLTCHASIVSREMGPPCVVGTGKASKVIKDGDLLEVFASQGLIKITPSP